jgi:hypothetical protein
VWGEVARENTRRLHEAQGSLVRSVIISIFLLHIVEIHLIFLGPIVGTCYLVNSLWAVAMGLGGLRSGGCIESTE